MIKSCSGNGKGEPHLALGSPAFSYTTPTCEQHAGRAIANGVQELQHVKSKTVGVELMVRLP